MRYCLTTLTALLCSLSMLAPAAASNAWQPGRTSFSATIGATSHGYDTALATAMPGETVSVAVSPGAGSGTFTLMAGAHLIAPTRKAAWRWRAPTGPGLYPLTLTRTDTGEQMHIQMFVLVPATRVRNGMLNGYRIGKYPTTAWRGLATYTPPRGFIEVTPALANVRVSPHFRLGQFLCKEAGGWPKYMLLRPQLLAKLELLLQQLNARSVHANTLYVMSGYRTPWYNRAIGNTTTYSRHVFGGAADVFVDVAPADGQIDDLDGDHASDRADAAWLYDVANGLHHPELVGGLGVYDRTASHGPFLHVDARGFPARWGIGRVASTAGGR